MSAESAPPGSASAAERVVLVDENGNATGTELKSRVHHHATPLHLAFSCYVFDSADRLLLTRRATHKVTWPGVWTNSVCGHPAPGEDIFDAVRRRARQELGLELNRVSLALPSFRYQAVMANGVRENELCPVFTAVTDQAPSPDPDEVDSTEWVSWPQFAADVREGLRAVSPWCVEQVGQLPRRMPWRTEVSPEGAGLLPPAARPAPAGPA